MNKTLSSVLSWLGGSSGVVGVVGALVVLDELLVSAAEFVLISLLALDARGSTTARIEQTAKAVVRVSKTRPDGRETDDGLTPWLVLLLLDVLDIRGRRTWRILQPFRRTRAVSVPSPQLGMHAKERQRGLLCC
jgi:hypothetical protein